MSHTPLLRRFALTLGLLVLSLASARAQEGFDITPVARLGDPVVAPATLVSASEPRLSDSDEVLFRGDQGLLLTSPEGHEVIAAPGDRTPDGRLILAIGDASMNADGEVAFVAFLEGFASSSGFSASALLLFSEGTITAIAQSGDPAPGGGTLGEFGGVALNADGHVAFVSAVDRDPVQDPVLYLYAEGAIKELARVRDPSIGGAGIYFDSVRINDAGQVVFATAFDIGPRSQPRGVFLITNGEVMPVATPGMAAPGDGTFARAQSPSINARGDVAFRATVTGPSGSSIFLFVNGTLTEIARDGDVVASGSSPAVEYALDATSSPSIDDLGRVAFQANVGTPSRSAVFLASGGVIQRLVGAGDLTRQGEILSSAAAPWFNGSGDLVFAEAVEPFGRVYLVTDKGISRVVGEGDTVAAATRVVSATTGLPVRSGQAFAASIFPGGIVIFDVVGALRTRIGDEAPGGGFINTISEIASSETGVVVFIASLSTGDSGVFVSGEEGLHEVVRTGAPAPGGGTFASLLRPAVNASGHVAFFASLAPTGGGIFLVSDGSIAPVVQTGTPGQPVPGGLGVSLNDLDEVAFIGAEPPGAPFRLVLYLASGRNVTPIVGAGDAAPGGGTFNFITSFALNAAGQVVIEASVSNPNAQGIFVFTPNEGIRSVARSGDPAPGGGAFASPQAPSLNAFGQIAFSSFRTGAPVDENPGIFLLSDGELQKIAQSGDPAPGGGTFTFVASPKMGGGGQIQFTAVVSADGLSRPLSPDGVFLARRPTSQPQVRIDIRPAGAANRVNPASDQQLRVAILSAEQFDAMTVVADAVRFGATGTEAAPTRVVVRDVDGDGDDDMVLRFRILDTGIQCGQTSALLTGRTSDDRTFAASDVIHTVRCP